MTNQTVIKKKLAVKVSMLSMSKKIIEKSPYCEWVLFYQFYRSVALLFYSRHRRQKSDIICWNWSQMGTIFLEVFRCISVSSILYAHSSDPTDRSCIIHVETSEGASLDILIPICRNEKDDLSVDPESMTWSEFCLARNCNGTKNGILIPSGHSWASFAWSRNHIHVHWT